MKEEEIPDLNIFMMCEDLNNNALTELGDGYYIRNCTKEDMEVWKAFPFDSEVLPEEYRAFMDEFVEKVYGKSMDTFYRNTLLVCQKGSEQPIATCSHWRSYGKINTIHWLKTLKSHEGKGLGRAVLSAVMRQFKPSDYPIYLHTQAGSFRAVKLYSDFGFKLLSGPQIGTRSNDLEKCLPILKEFIPAGDFAKLQIRDTPSELLKALEDETHIEF